MPVEEFEHKLRSCDVVLLVEEQESKTSEGNTGKHFQEAKFAVYFSDKSMKFELTRHGHMHPGSGAPQTLSVQFHGTSVHRRESWAVMREVALPHAVFPDIASQCCEVGERL